MNAWNEYRAIAKCTMRTALGLSNNEGETETDDTQEE